MPVKKTKGDFTMNNTGFLTRVAALALVLTLALLGAAAAENKRVEIEAAGLALNYDDALEAKGFDISGGGIDLNGNLFLAFGCIDPEIAEPIYAELEAAQESGNQNALMGVIEKYNAHHNGIAIVMILSKADYETYKASDSLPFIETEMTSLGEHNGYLYWVSFDSLEVGDKAQVQSETEISNWLEVAAALGDLSDVLEFIPVVKNQAVAEGETFPAFATKDMKGNDVTNDIFAGKDLTIVNFWATTCGPCISEMPELGEWARELPENVQIIGVLTDVTAGDAKKAAKVENIMSKAKAEFINLGADEVLYDYFSRRITGTPTTVLVNSCGEIVGDAIVGAYIEKYKEAVEAYLNGK